MPQLKKLAVDSVGEALRKAEQYRLLGEPCEAESICLDVLAVDPDNREARVMLILSLTDQFRMEPMRMAELKALVAQFDKGYERFYYSGIVSERVGKAQQRRAIPGSDAYAYGAIREAMSWYEKAEAVRPPGNDDAILRWNACARILERWGLRAQPGDPEWLPLMPD